MAGIVNRRESGVRFADERPTAKSRDGSSVSVGEKSSRGSTSTDQTAANHPTVVLRKEKVAMPNYVEFRRRTSSIKVLMEPTVALDTGWSWIVCVACFFCNFCLIGTLGAFGVLYVGLLEFYGGSQINDSNICSVKNTSTALSGETAWIGNQATLFTFLLGPLSAVLVARWGIRPVVITGAVLFSGGMFLTAATNEIWQATLTYGVMGGLGGSMIYTPAVGILPAYFQKRKAFAVCLAQSGGWIGNLVIVASVVTVRDAYGWRVQCLFMGGINLFLIIMGILYRPRPLEPTTTKPSVKDIIVQSCSSQQHMRFTVWVWLLALNFFQLYLVLFHLSRHAECKVGAHRSEASLLLTYLAPVAAISGIVGGIIQDYMNNKILLLQFVMFVGGMASLALPFMTSYSQLVGFAIMAGVAESFLSIMSVIPQDLVGIKEAVNAFGVLSFTSAATGALAGPAGGWAYDATGSYDVPFYVAGSISIAASLLMFTDFCFKRRPTEAEEKVDASKQVAPIEVIGSMESSV